MILETLVEATKKRIAVQKTVLPPEELRRQAEELARGQMPDGGGGVPDFCGQCQSMVDMGNPCPASSVQLGFKSLGQLFEPFRFEKALAAKGIHFICEVKKASPSKGLIAPDFPYVQIAKDYETAGADCISVLTETDYFLGSDEYFREIRARVALPMLRKDFTVDPYMIWQAKVMGADCVLLIGAVLREGELKEYLTLCDSLGLSALVETHNEDEVGMAVRAGARLLGVNNRNLKTFEVDLATSVRLRGLVPEDILFVAESGIRTAQDIRVLRQAEVNGVLIGETLMRSQDKREALDALRAG